MGNGGSDATDLLRTIACAAWLRGAWPERRCAVAAAEDRDRAAGHSAARAAAVASRPSFFTWQSKEGFYKKYGAHVELRPFDTGTTAARALIAGDVELTMSPSPVIIAQISNTGAELVAIYGLINSDFVLASADPSKRLARMSSARVSASIRSVERGRSHCATCWQADARASRSTT